MRTIALVNMLAAVLSTVTVTAILYMLLLSSDFTMTMATIQSKYNSTTTVAKHTAVSTAVEKITGELIVD